MKFLLKKTKFLLKHKLKLLFFIIILNNLIKFNKVNYLHYLMDKRKSIFFPFHFLLPSTIHKTSKGFYSVLFNKFVYEIFIDRDKRGGGEGVKMSRELVQKYPVIFCNPDTVDKFQDLCVQENKDYNRMLDILYIKDQTPVLPNPPAPL